MGFGPPPGPPGGSSKQQQLWTLGFFMYRNFRRNSVVVPLTVLVLALAFTCQTAEGQVKPFKVKGDGSAPEGLSVLGALSPYSVTGTATHLGNYSGVGFAQVTGPTT